MRQPSPLHATRRDDDHITIAIKGGGEGCAHERNVLQQDSGMSWLPGMGRTVRPVLCATSNLQACWHAGLLPANAIHGT